MLKAYFSYQNNLVSERVAVAFKTMFSTLDIEPVDGRHQPCQFLDQRVKNFIINSQILVSVRTVSENIDYLKQESELAYDSGKPIVLVAKKDVLLHGSFRDLHLIIIENGAFEITSDIPPTIMIETAKTIKKIKNTFNLNLVHFAELIRILDPAIYKVKNIYLKSPQREILRAAWEGKNYKQIAAILNYTENYIAHDAGPSLWRLLDEVLSPEILGEKKISISNFRGALERFYWSALN